MPTARCVASSRRVKHIAFPLGTVDTFGTYFAPADFNETVNTLGQPLYAKQEPRKFERGTDLHTQSNPLPMCHRPGVLVKLPMHPSKAASTSASATSTAFPSKCARPATSPS
jgi:hypothetical protein